MRTILLYTQSSCTWKSPKGFWYLVHCHHNFINREEHVFANKNLVFLYTIFFISQIIPKYIQALKGHTDCEIKWDAFLPSGRQENMEKKVPREEF